MKTHKKGFTLIELMLVISIIALLSSIVLAQTITARKKARDSVRIQNLKEVQKAVELYRTNNSGFPDTGGAWWTGGACNLAGAVQSKGYDATGYVPGIVPTFISSLPEDPSVNLSSGICYSYKSNGSEYMIVANNGAESFNPNNGYPLDRISTSDNSIAVFTDGARNW